MTGSCQQVPKFHKQWILPQTTGHQALVLDQQATLASPGENEVLVEIWAASLNYREIVVAKGGAGGNVRPNLVPGSDGAGIVKAVGSKVKQLKQGDRVVSHLCPDVEDDHIPTFPDICAGIGHGKDGTLREYGVFHESALVHAPKNLSFEKAATLTCSGLTAWNALQDVKHGDWVLVQGTGGVSVAALQFAVAKGANVVATTSAEEKAARLKKLGAKGVVNYRKTSNWGEETRKMTKDGRGFDCVVDVGGNGTLPESLKAVRTGGSVILTGILTGQEPEAVPLMAALFSVCTVRGILLGTRAKFRDLVKFVEEKDVQPVLDDVESAMEQVKECYERLEGQKHFSKVIVKIRQHRLNHLQILDPRDKFALPHAPALLK